MRESDKDLGDDRPFPAAFGIRVTVHGSEARQVPQKNGKTIYCNTREPYWSSPGMARFPEATRASVRGSRECPENVTPQRHI